MIVGDGVPPTMKEGRRWAVAEIQISANGNVFNRLCYYRPRESSFPDGMHTIGGVMKDSIRSLTTWKGRMTDDLIAYSESTHKRDISRKRPWQAGWCRHVDTFQIHACFV